MKTCNGCRESKSADEFYRATKGGLSSKCKACTRAAVREHRQANLARIQAYDRERGLVAHRRERVAAYHRTDAGREASRRAKQAWAERNRSKRLAQTAVGNAVTRRRMARKPCEVCGTTDGVQGHHDDYSRPLDVRWLCVTHHAEHHRDEREKARRIAVN